MNNKKTTKRALLSSVVAMLVCITMLIGTTFAWFTDTASTGVNKIQAGTLKIGLEMKNATGGWDDAEGASLAWKKASGTPSGEATLWEPGVTYELPLLKITNLGNLETQFQVQINGITGTDKNGQPSTKLLDALNFEVVFLTDEEYFDIFSPDELAALTSSFGGSYLNNLPYKIGIPSYITQSDPGLTGIRLRQNGDGGDTFYVRIRAHMDESANNDYQGLSLDNIGITVVATQLPEEYDSFGNQYDKDAEYAIPVATAAELAKALTSGNDVVLTAPIQMPEIIEVKGDITIYGEGDGKLLVPDNADRVINITDTTEPVTLTLSNVDVVGPTTGAYTRGVSVYGNTDVTIVADNSSVSANYYALNIASANDNVKAVIKNTTLTGWCAFQTWSAGTKATFENCMLIGNNTFSHSPDNNFATVVINEGTTDVELTFKDCRIEANQTTGNMQYLISIRASGAKVTMDGCTFFADGTELASNALKNYIDVYSPEAVDFNMSIDGRTLTANDVFIDE